MAAAVDEHARTLPDARRMEPASRRQPRTSRARFTLFALLVAIVVAGAAGPATAAVSHLVQPGETLWSISAANNLTTRTVAAFNGLREDALVIDGQTLQIPTVAEGAAALSAAGITPGAMSASGPGIQAAASPTASGAPAPASGSTYGLGHIPSPWGELHLDPTAADSWNAMREAALAQFGVDLYPDGPLSAYRTLEQQAYLYDLFVSGQGAPANPSGTSSHELGIAVDVAEPVMREVIDQIGPTYGWGGTIPSEWWHVAYLGS